MQQRSRIFISNGIDMKNYSIQTTPFIVPTSDGKLIAEHFGLATNGQSELSVAYMEAPPGWSEPYQTPEFDEYTIIIEGKKQMVIDGDTIVLEAGQSIKVHKNTRVQYSNPFLEPCKYIAICLPAFSIQSVHREE